MSEYSSSSPVQLTGDSPCAPEVFRGVEPANPASCGTTKLGM